MTNSTMLLAIDIGNSQTKLGLFRGRTLVATSRFPISNETAQTNILSHINQLCRSARISSRTITGAVVSSVVPKQSAVFKSTLKKHFNIQPLIVTGKLDVGMKLKYKKPSKLGADRLCNAAAAFHRFGGPVIVVDLGTATKYEAISKRGEYLGGAIAVGLGTAASALHGRTALLPAIPLTVPRSIIGTTTAGSMQSGTFYGAFDAMEGMIARFRHITGKTSKVIATGGFAKLVAQHSKNVDRIEPHLVLHGARLIFERLNGRKK